MNTPPDRQQGFTIVEVMIAMTIGLLIIAALASIFVFSSRNYRQDERVARISDELRFAMAQIANDLEMAGFWSQLHNPNNITVNSDLKVAKDCGKAAAPATWTFNNLQPVEVIDDATTTTALEQFPCFTADQITPNTDIIAIKRADGARARALSRTGAITVPDRREANRVYFRTNGVLGALYRAVPQAGGDYAEPEEKIAVPYSEWQYTPAIYFIRPYLVDAGDGIPSLCRKVLRGGDPPQWETECLTAGIESLQLEFGVDTDRDDSVDYYIAAPTPAQLAAAISVRVLMLARSLEPDPTYTNPKTYALSNEGDFTPADGFYRKVLTGTVKLHNPASLRNISGS